MKKKISILLTMVFVVTAILSTVVIATDDNIANGFYNIEEVEDILITVYSGNSVANAVDKDVDGDDVEDAWYANSDRIEVEYTNATPGNYYGVILVDGTGLPTSDNEICYINQVEAESSTISFNVYPKIPEDTTEMTLYISSSDEDEDLVSFTLYYARDIEYTAYPLGDVYPDGKYDVRDALIVLQIGIGKFDSDPNIEALKEAGDINKDTKLDVRDALLILQRGIGKIDSFN